MDAACDNPMGREIVISKGRGGAVATRAGFLVPGVTTLARSSVMVPPRRSLTQTWMPSVARPVGRLQPASRTKGGDGHQLFFGSLKELG
jgi:hypothetical protein